MGFLNKMIKSLLLLSLRLVCKIVGIFAKIDVHSVFLMTSAKNVSQYGQYFFTILFPLCVPSFMIIE